MATWKKIVTESGADQISQDTTGNANTATTLAAAQNFSITGEVTASAVSFNGSLPVALSAEVANDVIDTANFTTGTLVTEADGIANNDNDTTIATSAAIIDYVADQVAAAGSGTITSVQVSTGNGLDNTGAADGSAVTSGVFADTLVVVADDGITVSASGVKADVDGTTIQLTNTDGTGKIAANTTNGIASGNNNLVTGGQVADYVAANASNSSGTVTSIGTSGSVNGITLTGGTITTSGTITLGGTLSGIGNAALTNDSTHLGGTELVLGNGADSVTEVTGMTQITGVAAGMSLSNVGDINGISSAHNIFTGNYNHNVTIGSGSAGYGVVIAGDLTVNGVTTTVNTANVNIEDKLLKLAHNDDAASQTVDNADQAGLQVATSGTEANWPELKWYKNLGASNAGGSAYNGSGTGIGLTGWHLSNHQLTNQADYPIAVMQMVDNSTAAPTGDSAGIGSFYFTTDSPGTNDGELYIRTS